MKITKKLIQQKQGEGNFSTKVKKKMKKQKKNSLFEHRYYSNTYEVPT